MDVPARLINDKTLVPLRFLSEEPGFNVEWNEVERLVAISEQSSCIEKSYEKNAQVTKNREYQRKTRNGEISQ